MIVGGRSGRLFWKSEKRLFNIIVLLINFMIVFVVTTFIIIIKIVPTM